MTCSLVCFGMGAAGFNPGKVGSPTAFFRSDQVALDVSNNVQSMADQTGNGYTVTQATSGNRPSYSATGGVKGLPKLNFGVSGGSSVLLANSAFTLAPYPLEIIIVAASSNPTAADHQYLCDLGDLNDIVVINTGVAAGMSTYNGSYNSDPSTITASTPFVVDMCNLGSASSFIAVNGDSPTTGDIGETAQAASVLTIGNYHHGGVNWIGDWYEMWIGPELSAANRAAYLEYVSARYGIAT